MDKSTRQRIQAIHDTPTMAMLVMAGAGTQMLSDLLGVAGASRTILEALVPYSVPAFDEFLGFTPEKYVAANTARLLAGRALTRARWLRQDKGPVVGLACTATIVTDRPKKGEHRAHIALWQPERLVWYGLHLEKGARDRQGEERLVSTLMLHVLTVACGLPDTLALPLGSADRLESDVQDFAAAAAQLLRGEIPFLGIYAHGLLRTADICPQVLLPGAFDPLHMGHLGMAEAASDLLGKPVAFEVSAANADKPLLTQEALLARLAQFAGRYPVYATAAPTFLEKARLFPGVTFVLGFDTAVRLLHPRYYHGTHSHMLAALREMGELGCRFLVAGRVDEDGRFQQLSDLPIPRPFQHLFQAIPAERFREDVSSTYLRATGGKGAR